MSANATTDLVPLDEERKVVARLQAGDRSAFATLYGWYGDRLFRQVIWPRLPNREAAEDCLRDTFRTALEKISSFTLTDRSIFFWLRRIALNKAMDAHRLRQRDQRLADSVKAESELTTNEPDPTHAMGREQLRRMIDTSLTLLNERYATALRLRLLEDKSREECAELLDVTLGTFDVLLHRAVKAFRKVYPP